MTSSRHWKIKEKAQMLRKKGLSYSEITSELGIQKSSISNWCSQIKLKPYQLKRLRAKRGNYLVGIKKIQNAFQKARETAFAEGKVMYDSIKSKEEFIAGLMIYWAEGTKHKNVSISNSDPKLIRFMSKWFSEFFEVDSKDFRLHLHLHTGQNENEMKKFWSKLLGINSSQFYKSFVKKEGSGYRKRKLYNGTINLRVGGEGSTLMLFRIFGAISGFVEKTDDGNEELDVWIKKLQYAD